MTSKPIHAPRSTLAGCLLAMLLGGCSEPKAPPPGLSLDAILAPTETAGYEAAERPRAFVFPEDHGEHPGFRSEWWYVTGNLATSDGARYGYQFTIFRLATSAAPAGGASAWRSHQFYLAHGALTDASGRRFLQEQRASRGALGLAGATGTPFAAWVEDWRIEADPGCADCSTFRLVVPGEDFRLELQLVSLKPAVAHGDRGLSFKNREGTSASYYYSLSRLATTGRVVSGGREIEVSGDSWFDHEWSTSTLSPAQSGWDWFGLQLSSGEELMLFRIRAKEQDAPAFQDGTRIAPDGTARALGSDTWQIRSTAAWRSPLTGVRYPAAWQLGTADGSGTLELLPLLPDQEIDLALRYWEGAVTVSGRLDGRPVSGRGYVELTGYDPPGTPAGSPP